MLESGAAKGALGTDKVADAFKEFGLTLIDVNDGSKDVYKELGLNQQKLVDDVNSGALTQAKAFELVTNKLKDVKGKAVFSPHDRLSKEEFEKLGYPRPHVDYSETAARAKARYKQDLADAPAA